MREALSKKKKKKQWSDLPTNTETTSSKFLVERKFAMVPGGVHLNLSKCGLFYPFFPPDRPSVYSKVDQSAFSLCLSHYPDLYHKSPVSLEGECRPQRSVCVHQDTTAQGRWWQPFCLMLFPWSVPKHYFSLGSVPWLFSLTQFTPFPGLPQMLSWLPLAWTWCDSQSPVSPGIQPPKYPGSPNM